MITEYSFSVSVLETRDGIAFVRRSTVDLGQKCPLPFDRVYTVESSKLIQDRHFTTVPAGTELVDTGETRSSVYWTDERINAEMARRPARRRPRGETIREREDAYEDNKPS